MTSGSSRRNQTLLLQNSSPVISTLIKSKLLKTIMINMLKDFSKINSLVLLICDFKCLPMKIVQTWKRLKWYFCYSMTRLILTTAKQLIFLFPKFQDTKKLMNTATSSACPSRIKFTKPCPSATMILTCALTLVPKYSSLWWRMQQQNVTNLK